MSDRAHASARAGANPPTAAGVAAGLARLLPVAVCLVLAAACRRGAPQGFELRSLVAAGRFAVDPAASAAAAGATAAPPGLVFAARPQLADVEVDHERRPVVLAAAAPWSWTGRVPRQAELHAGLQLVPAARPLVRRMQALVTLHAGRETEVLQVARTDERVDPQWLDLSADLGRYAGREVTLVFTVNLAGQPGAAAGGNLVA